MTSSWAQSPRVHTWYKGHEMSLEPCERCYSVLYNRNSTARMRSNTNIRNLGWNNILIEKKWKITKLHGYVIENPRYTEVIFNQSGAELRVHNGGTHESATMLENSIEEDLWSISMAPKMSRNFKINALSCSPKRSRWGWLSQSIMGQWPHWELLMN